MNPHGLEAAKKLVPEHLLPGLLAYIFDHREPGGFLRAVVANDLFGAMSRGDDVSRAGLCGLVEWLYWHAPRLCWGSAERLREWLAQEKQL